MSFVNGRWVWREESCMGREEEKGEDKKKKEKKRAGLARKRQDTDMGPTI